MRIAILSALIFCPVVASAQQAPPLEPKKDVPATQDPLRLAPKNPFCLQLHMSHRAFWLPPRPQPSRLRLSLLHRRPLRLRFLEVPRLTPNSSTRTSA